MTEPKPEAQTLTPSAAARFGHSVFRLWLAVTLIAAIATWVGFGALFGLKAAVGVECRQVLTASMEPFMPVGSYVCSSEPMGADLTVGKPVVIKTDQGVIYTHRVISVTDGVATTKGDNSELADLFQTRQENVIGVPFAVIRDVPAVVLTVISSLQFVALVTVVLILTLIGQAAVNGLLDRRDRKRYEAYIARITSSASTAESDTTIKDTTPTS